MELINQRTKKIMEDCKIKARKAGLQFEDETLEYIVTNKDMLDLSPKVMIPTLYDYWVHDVEVLKGHGKYKLYPSNPYETVINSRPAISFYNDNNPDWMNIMIFYHVLGHIDFFQNNMLFEHTWNDDFVGQALSDKRLIASLRSEHGRWVDYIIEFSRSIDNLVGYFAKLAQINFPKNYKLNDKLDFFFDTFLQQIVNLNQTKVFDYIQKYNTLLDEHDSAIAENIFFNEIQKVYPEFQAKYEKHFQEIERIDESQDIMQFIMANSPFLRKESNAWMKSVMSIVRNTSMYFQPQIRSKIINEGWASYWHDALFRADDRIAGHESAYAKTNAAVTSVQRVGLNPYAIGLRLLQYVENLADKGKMNIQYQKLLLKDKRDNYNTQNNKGKDTIYLLRKYFSDFMLINTFVDQDFTDTYNLFVVGKRLDQQRGVWQYYVKSRKAEDYKKMLLDSLYHPPKMFVNIEKTSDDNLYIEHVFEHKQLVKDFVPDTLIGIEYLWGGQVQLETTEIVAKQMGNKTTYSNRKVLYTIKNKKVSKRIL